MAFVKFHLPCDECGSSDAVSVNDDGSGYCFSCETFHKEYDNSLTGYKVQPIKINTYSKPSFGGEFYPLTDRDISVDTAKKYNVRSVRDHRGNIVEHSYPYYINNEAVASKVRKTSDKSFSWTSTPKGTGLFGQQLFQTGGKFLTIVEGECDAMATYELLGSKWPVVSIKNGAASADKDIKESLEFVESFDTVVICFDNDKVGREAARKVARLLRPGKAKIYTLPEEFKDPNEMLRKKQHKAFVLGWWDSKAYTPSGVVSATSDIHNYLNREQKKSIPYPWSGLNDKLEGMRLGELITLTGGTGLGKSSVTRELEHWLINNTKDNIGIIALEENRNRTIDGVLSIEANKKLHLNSIRDTLTTEQLEALHNKVFGGENTDRVWVYSHLGMNDLESVFSKLRFMIIGCDCKWIVLDHLHMLVLLALENDERKAIDMIMHRLRSLVEETGVGMILVSHLRRIDGNRGHENGIETGLNHLRGSQSIAQLSDAVIGLERNQQSDDKIEASTTRVRVLKSRYTGDVGLATSLYYEYNTGRLQEIATDNNLTIIEDEDYENSYI